MIDLSSYQSRNNRTINHWLDRLPLQSQSLVRAMRYSLLIGGKRARPCLVYITGRMLGCELAELDTPASAIECLHTYSLIHDDLPAMDNDRLRRGYQSCHVKFSEATAILAGDALQTLAFSILSEGVLSKKAESNRLKMVRSLALTSGANGMCLGQALDLEAEGDLVTSKQLEKIYEKKTGALIRCAVRLGALAAGEKAESLLPHLENYSKAIGLAFQIQDDILDIISDTEILGKPQGSDKRLKKSTYPSLLGLDKAREKARCLLDNALDALELIPCNTDILKQFSRYIVERKN